MATEDKPSSATTFLVLFFSDLLFVSSLGPAIKKKDF